MTLVLLRQSMIGQDCLRRAWYTTHNPVQFSSAESAVGTGYHAAMEVYYRARIEGGNHERTLGVLERQFDVAPWVAMYNAAVEALHREWELIPDREGVSLSQLELRLEKLLEHWWENECWWDDDWAVLAVEWGFKSEYDPNTLITGSVDLALKNRVTLEHRLVDHKTAKKRWAASKASPRRPQPSWYVHWWKHFWTGDPPPYVGFSFDVLSCTDDKMATHFDRWNVIVGPEHERLVLGHAAAVHDIVSRPVPPPGNPESNLCSQKWCSYWDICPYGAEVSPAE